MSTLKEELSRGWPSFEDDEIAAVERVLRSGRVNQWTGGEVKDFEEAFAKFVDADYAVALANGTVALELALRSLGIGQGDDVIVTSRSFVASAGAVSLVGATPVFADVDRVSQNLTADTIGDVLTGSTRAILLVHLGGWPCDMDEILDLADEQDLFLIEDCAQALGANYKGRSVGTWGDVAAWSFCQDKILTTGGEGGMLTTNDEAICEWVWSYKDHGKDWHKMADAAPGPSFRWVHDSIGTNLRMTEIQAAIGNVALPKVPGWVERRREIAALLDDRLSGHPRIRTTVPSSAFYHAYYRYYVFVDPGTDRDAVLAALHTEGIPAFSGICGEIYREAVFEDAGFAPEERHPVARELAETSIMVPIHPNVTVEAAERVAEAIRACV